MLRTRVSLTEQLEVDLQNQFNLESFFFYFPDVFCIVMKLVILDPSFRCFQDLVSISTFWIKKFKSCDESFWIDLFELDFGYLLTCPYYAETWKIVFKSIAPLHDCSAMFRYVYLKNQVTSDYVRAVFHCAQEGSWRPSVKKMVSYLYNLSGYRSWYKRLCLEVYSKLTIFIDPYKKSRRNFLKAYPFWYDSIQAYLM